MNKYQIYSFAELLASVADEVARLRALVALGVEAATAAERRGWDRYEYPACPVCGACADDYPEPTPISHTEDCTLARFLRESAETESP